MKKVNYAELFTLRSDGRYMGYWHDQQGKRHAIYRRDPEELFHAIQEKEKPSVVTFEMAAAEWERKYRQQVTDRTWNNFRSHYEKIIAEFGEEPVENITAQDIILYLQRAKARQYSKSVVNSIRVIFNGILNHAVGKGYIPYNPGMSVKLPKNLPHEKRRAPTDDEIATIVEHAMDGFGFFPYMLLCTGMRRTECLSLKRSNIDLERREIDITASKTESGIRTVPIIDALVEPLKKWMREHRWSQYLFPSVSYNGMAGKGRMTEAQYVHAWKKYCAEVGFMDTDGKCTVTAHNLRHGTATLMYEAGVDEFSTMRILGHANISTTREIYTELRAKKSAAGVKRFNEALSALLSTGEKPQ